MILLIWLKINLATSACSVHHRPLSPRQAAVEELLSAVEGLDLRLVRGDYGEGFEGGDHAVEPLRLCLLRFLRGNGFCVSKALSQV